MACLRGILNRAEIKMGRRPSSKDPDNVAISKPRVPVKIKRYRIRDV